MARARLMPGAGAARLAPPKKLLPGVAWVVLFLIVPLSSMFVMSFWTASIAGIVPDWTLKSYATLVNKPVYLGLLVKSVRIALTVTLLTLIVAYPFAYWTMRRPARQKAVIMFLVLIPFWTSYLVRTYAWFPLLGTNGIVNLVLLKLGIISEPLDILLFNEGAVHLAMLYVYLP